MNIEHIYLTVQVSKFAEGEHRINMHWPVQITGCAYLEAARKLASYTRSAEEHVKGCGLLQLPDRFSLQSLSASPDWTMHQIFDAKIGLSHLQMHATIKASGALVTYSRQREKRSMLVLPSLIDFAGSIDIIRRIQEVDCYALSLYLDEGWQRMRRGQFAVRSANRRSSPCLGTLTGGATESGNPNIKPTND